MATNAFGSRVFPEPHRVELEELTVRLDDLDPHEVVVRARLSVISPGTELAYYRGDSLGGAILGAQRPGTPFYPGYAMVGSVMAAGAECEFATDSSLLSHTPHQPVTRFDPREHVCVSLPEELNLDVAPFARLAQVGAVSLRLAVARPGDAIAVVGLGPIGNLVAQLASVSGYCRHGDRDLRSVWRGDIRWGAVACGTGGAGERDCGAYLPAISLTLQRLGMAGTSLRGGPIRYGTIVSAAKFGISSMPFPEISTATTPLSANGPARSGKRSGGTSYMIPAHTAGKH